jgi:hypothetical protein
MPRLNAMKWLTLAYIFFGCSAIVVAQEPSKVGQRQPISSEKRALIAELLEVTDSKKSASEVYQAMLDQQEKMIPDLLVQAVESKKDFQELTDEQKTEVRKELLEASARTSKRVRVLLDERIDFSKIVEDISYELYDKYFTEAELKDLISFYRTPTGKKTIVVTPKMFGESINITLETIKPKMSEVMTILMKEEAERIDKELETLKKEAAKAKPVRRRKRKL